MFEADAKPDLPREPLPAAEGPEPVRQADTPVLLEPLRPSPGSTVEDVPGGAVSFAWRVDTGALEAAYPGRRLRTDFCLRVAGETRGCFVMLAFSSDTSAVTLPLDEIRRKLGPNYARPARVNVRWSLTLSLATGGPLFATPESDLALAPRRERRP